MHNVEGCPKGVRANFIHCFGTSELRSRDCREQGARRQEVAADDADETARRAGAVLAPRDFHALVRCNNAIHNVCMEAQPQAADLHRHFRREAEHDPKSTVAALVGRLHDHVEKRLAELIHCDLPIGVDRLHVAAGL